MKLSSRSSAKTDPTPTTPETGGSPEANSPTTGGPTGDTSTPGPSFVITGGRDFSSKATIRALLHFLDSQGNEVLIQGGAPGADTLAHQVWTKEFEKPSVTVPAEWKVYGKGAGHRRNARLVTESWGTPDFLGDVYGLPGGAGTRDCLTQAMQAGLVTYHVQPVKVGNQASFELIQLFDAKDILYHYGELDDAE